MVSNFYTFKFSIHSNFLCTPFYYLFITFFILKILFCFTGLLWIIFNNLVKRLSNILHRGCSSDTNKSWILTKLTTIEHVTSVLTSTYFLSYTLTLSIPSVLVFLVCNQTETVQFPGLTEGLKTKDNDPFINPKNNCPLFSLFKFYFFVPKKGENFLLLSLLLVFIYLFKRLVGIISVDLLSSCIFLLKCREVVPV